MTFYFRYSLQTLPAFLSRCVLCVMCENIFIERLGGGIGCQATPWKYRATEFICLGHLGKDILLPWALVLSLQQMGIIDVS